MSMAFEVTQDDVIQVLNSHNVEIPSDMDEVMAIIDDCEIEKAALSVDIDSDDDEDYIFIRKQRLHTMKSHGNSTKLDSLQNSKLISMEIQIY